MCTDYVIKWVKAKSFPRYTEQVAVDFLYEDIFTWFGVPREIVTNQGTQFTSKLVQYLTHQYHIKHGLYCPYHPKNNGKVESTIKVLKKKLQNSSAASKRLGQSIT